MIQSRFFHSSLKEIEFNIKEIYSLQSELRKRVLATTNKLAKSEFQSNLNDIKKGIKSAQEPSKEHKKINRTLKGVLIFFVFFIL